LNRLLSRHLSLLALTLLMVLGPANAWASSPGNVAIPPPSWTVVFFVAMLLTIAIVPLTKLSHWWEHNSNKLIVSLVLGAYPLYHLLVVQPSVHQLLDTMHEYASFITLLGSLFYISGGLLLKGDLRATPTTNMAFLGLGTVIASLVGTTGASMLLIRPVLRTNKDRKNKVHVVIFFIFLVSNVGGSLLPLGDPPLFLGYLQGVPFWWTLNLWQQMGMVAVALLVGFYMLDTHYYKQEPKAAKRADAANVEPLRVEGLVNLLWLGGIVACVALITDENSFKFARELAMIGCAIASKLTTPGETRAKNFFTWGPILEVAALFIGIFITMIPALMLLKAEGGNLGVNTPAKFFWASGTLSSFLDNAPTYLVFYNTAQGMVVNGQLAATSLVASTGIPFTILLAISCGSVFMGANTYIGNGPNFMVKAIAEEQGVQMPSFFGYMRWSVLILVPLFVVTTFAFFM